ncbi:alpha/beta hydrolase family protein [Aquimarina rhabdastrellae]
MMLFVFALQGCKNEKKANTPTEKQINTNDMAQTKINEQAMEALMAGTSYPPHAPILKTPADYGLEYEEITFSTEDGVELAGWFIPADSDRLIISNHFSPGNKYGYPGHIKEFENPAGEINAIPRYKALHDAGYSVLTYDNRGHGESPDDKDGTIGLGQKEWQEVVASLELAKTDERMAGKKVGMFNVCMGANCAMVAMEKRPDLFEDVKAQMLLQPFNMRVMVDKGFGLMGADAKTLMPEFEKRYTEKTGFDIDDHDMTKYVDAIKMPTFVVQVRNDFMTDVQVVQDVYDALKVEDKKMFWIEDTPYRFDAYKYFSDHPEMMLEWFDGHMK